MTFRISADESLKFTTKGTDRLSQKRELGIRKDGQLRRFLLLGLALLMLAMALSVPADAQTNPTFTVTCPTKARLNVENAAKMSGAGFASATPIAAMEFKVDISGRNLTSYASLVTGKALECNPVDGAADSCILVGLNQTTLADGDLVELKWIPVALPITLNVTDMLGSDPDGNAVALTAPTSCSITMIYGDADGSGTIDCSDMQRVIDVALKRITPPAGDQSDQDGDSQINVLDVQRVINEMIAAGTTSCP